MNNTEKQISSEDMTSKVMFIDQILSIVDVQRIDASFLMNVKLLGQISADRIDVPYINCALLLKGTSRN